MTTYSKRLVIVGDSIPQGGKRVVTSASFSGSGTTGTITSGTNFIPGGKIYITNASATDDAWNGVKTISTFSASGATCTFTNDTTLTASPTVDSAFSFITIGYDYQSNERDFYTQANGRTILPFSEIVNRAGSGRRTDHVLAKIADAVSLKPGALAIQCGTNDCLQGIADATIKANLQAIVEKGLNIGAIVFLHTLPPIGPSASGYTTTIRNRALRINQWIKMYARATPGVVLIDTYAAVVLASDGDWRSGYSSDDIHPTSIGAHAIADHIKTVWDALGLAGTNPSVSSTIDCYDTDNTNPNVAMNPVMNSSGGTTGTGFIGTMPLNWTISRWAGTPTATAALVARADGAGNNMEVTMTASANSDQVLLSHFITSGQTRVTVGDTVQLELEFGMSGSTALRSRTVAIYYQSSGSVDNWIYATTDDGSDQNLTNQTVIYQTSPFTLSANQTLSNFQVYIILRFRGSDAGVYTVGRVSLRKLSPSALVQGRRTITKSAMVTDLMGNEL